MVSDGEFCSLRTRGETRALHTWQLIHDAKEAVKKMSKTTLLEMLKMTHGKTAISFIFLEYLCVCFNTFALISPNAIVSR